MNLSERLTLILLSLMLLPLLSVSIIVLSTAWLSDSPGVWEVFSSHWTTLFWFAVVIVCCVVTALVLGLKLSEQLAAVSDAANAVAHGERPGDYIRLQDLIQELRPLYESITACSEFDASVTTLLSDVLRTGEKKTLTLRSEQDEFVTVLNTLIARLLHLSQATMFVADGDLAALRMLGAGQGQGTEQSVYQMLSELEGLIVKARDSTNKILCAGSHINSITMQGVQDAKNVTTRINGISQSIHHVALNIQQVAEHLQEQSGLLGDTSSSIAHTVHSIEEIGKNIASLKAIVEKSTPSSLASERTSFSLDLLDESTQAIERDATTCVGCSQQASEKAGQAKLAVQQTITGIGYIRASMKEFFEIIARLGERAEEVNDILEVLSDIADHTTLLAINAAIISAHAGDHGRDFAVIADEIAKFAERTRESTHEIEELLKAIQTEVLNATQAVETSSKAVETGETLSHNAGESLAEITDIVHNAQKVVSRIAAATTSQGRENERIRGIMKDLVQSQTEKREQVDTILWHLTQAIARIRGFTTEQAEDNARIAVLAQNVDQITQEIRRASQSHVTNANQIVEAVNYIRKLLHRTTIGTEKATQLTNELFIQGGNLALNVGEFILSERKPVHIETGDRPAIGFVRRSSANFFEDMAAGARKEAECHGFQVIETNSEYEATIQAEDVNWLLRQPSLQGIILCPVDSYVAQKLVQKSLEMNIACVATDESIPATISVRSGNREGGRQAAEIFYDHLSAQALIGVVVDRTFESMVRRLEGFQHQAEQYGFEVFEISCAVADHERMKKTIVTGIKDNPDLNGLFLTSEIVTVTYLSLLHEGGLPKSDMLTVGYDHTPDTESAIRNGDLLGAIFQHPEEIGKQAFRHLNRLIQQDLKIGSFERQTVYIPTVKVTKATLDIVRGGLEL